MPITYNPKDASNCWPAGEYPASLVSVADGHSKTSGNPMQTWQIDVWHDDGRKQTVTEYVVIPAALFKVKQLARAIGQGPDFDAGTFQPEDHLGSTFRVELVVEAQDGFDDKNKVGKFKAGNGPAAPSPTPRQTERPVGHRAGANFQTPERPARGKPQDPFGNTMEFKEDDIPF